MTWRSRRVIAERVDGRWHSMDADGNVQAHASAAALYRWVKAADAAAAREGTSSITEIEWRDPPPGFTPPKEERSR